MYAASQAGVEIDLIIRGMCALRPGLRTVSERIRVRSVVGRLLEHSRIFWFGNGSTPEDDTSEVFCGSADWMPRNLYERCEAVFPVTQPDLTHRLRYQILEAYLADNVKARLLQPGGEYVRPVRATNPVEAQKQLLELASGGSKDLDNAGSVSPARKVRAARKPASPVA